MEALLHFKPKRVIITVFFKYKIKSLEQQDQNQQRIVHIDYQQHRQEKSYHTDYMPRSI